MALPIAATLTLNTRNFMSGLGAARTGLVGLGGAFTKLAGTLVKTTAAFTALGVGAAAAITSITLKQTTLIASLEDTRLKLGVTAEFLQKFRYAAEQAGIGADTTDMALQRMTRRMAEAAKGTGEAKEALKTMGINLRDTSGNVRSVEDVMFDVADAFQNTTNSSEKLRLAFKLFDSEGVDFVNVLSQGSEGLKAMFSQAEALGMVMSNDAVTGVKSFDDSLTDLFAIIQGVVNQIVSAFAPALKELVTQLVTYVQNLAEVHGGFKGLGVYLAGEFLNIMQGAGVSILTFFQMIEESILSLYDNIASLPGAETLFGISEREGAETLARIREIKDELDALNKLPEQQRGPLFAEGVADLEEELAGLYQNTDSRLEGMIQTYTQGIDFLRSKLEEVPSMAETLVPEDALEKPKTFLEELTEMTGGYTEKLREANSVHDDIMKTIDETAEPAKKMKDQYEELKDTINGFTRDFTNNLVDGLMQGELKFKDFAKNVLATIMKMSLNKVFTNFFSMITGGMGAGGGGIMGGISKVFAGLFDNGGFIGAGKVGLVGERGPELVTGPANVIGRADTAQLMGGGGSTTVNYNISAVDALSFKQMVAQDPEFIYSITQRGARGIPR